jgi:serine/threonine protein kinase
MFTPCGTVGFASPENIAAVAERRSKFAADIQTMNKADMFSLGVVAFMMLSSSKPFKGQRFPEMHNEVKAGLRCDGKGWNHVGSAAKMLVERMLRGDTGARASAEEVMQDPWVLEGGRRFREVITTRQQLLRAQREQLAEEWDMPTIEHRSTGGPGNASLPGAPASDGCWTIEGEVIGAQSRFVS